MNGPNISGDSSGDSHADSSGDLGGDHCQTLAYGWQIQRSDGVTLGFTSHDQNQIVGGVTLLAQPGLAPTKIISSLGTQSDGLDIEGGLTDEALREDDLQNGRWNAARTHIFLYDWADLSADIITLARGELGEVRRSNGVFNAEFLGLTAQLDHMVAPVTSPNCRARFGDTDCKINIMRFTQEVMVERIDGEQLLLSEDLAANRHDFAFGELRWLSGPWSGLSTYILDNEARSLSVIEVPPSTAPAAKGPLNYRAQIMMGCDKNISTCSNRFQNSINFRGEPYLPGNDLLTRYPGAN